MAEREFYIVSANGECMGPYSMPHLLYILQIMLPLVVGLGIQEKLHGF